MAELVGSHLRFFDGNTVELAEPSLGVLYQANKSATEVQGEWLGMLHMWIGITRVKSPVRRVLLGYTIDESFIRCNFLDPARKLGMLRRSEKPGLTPNADEALRIGFNFVPRGRLMLVEHIFAGMLAQSEQEGDGITAKILSRWRLDRGILFPQLPKLRSLGTV